MRSLMNGEYTTAALLTALHLLLPIYYYYFPMPDTSLVSTFTTLAWVVFAAAAALSAVLGVILAYHWIRFSMSPVVSLIALVVYGSGCILFLFIMFVALLSL